MNRLFGKVVEIGDLEHLQDCDVNNSGLVILVTREQLRNVGRNFAYEQVAVEVHENKTPKEFHAVFSAWADRRPFAYKTPQWPEGEDIALCTVRRHKPSGRLGCVIGFCFDENSVTVWFDEYTRWTGTKQDFNAHFGAAESIN